MISQSKVTLTILDNTQQMYNLSTTQQNSRRDASSDEFRPLNTTDIIKIRVIRAIRAKKKMSRNKST